MLACRWLRMGPSVFIACNASALVAAWCLARCALPSGRPLERALATAVGLPMLVIPTATVLGALGRFRLGPMATAIAIEMLALLVMLVLTRQRADDGGPALETHATPSRALWPEHAAFGAALASAAALAWAIGSAQLLRGVRPQWDDLSYHGPMAAHWVQAGRLVLAPFSYHAYYAGNGELFAAWLMLPTRLDAYAGLCGFYWLVVGALAVAQIGQRLGTGAAASTLTVSSLLACQPFAEQARSFAAVDLAGAVLVAASFALSIGPPQPPAKSDLRSRVLYAGCLAGLAAGAKLTYAPVAALPCLWLLLTHKPRAGTAVRLSLLFLLCALASGGYWYARNFALADNPVFPASLAFFDGPLDALTRERTSLWFQLKLLSGPSLTLALSQLADWPTLMADAFAAGYALTSLALLRPRFFRDPVAIRVLLLLVAGLLALAIAMTGPFSGTANARGAHLQVRLRFLLLLPLFGLPLLAFWIGRTGRLRPLLVIAGAVASLRCAHFEWEWAAALPVAGAVSSIGASMAWGWLLVRVRAGTEWVAHARRRSAVALAACMALPLLAQLAMREKVPDQLRVMSSIAPAWHVPDGLPPGARLTWFTTFESYKYYLGFGPGLSHVPIAVQPDGSRFVFMHEGFVHSRSSWWRPKRRRPQPASDRPKPPSEETVHPDLVANLQAQAIEYVLVMRKRQGSWPSQYSALMSSPMARLLLKRHDAVLFRLTEARR
ncbi:MAG: hypothetical protein ACHQ53_08235 [Polyangiales bacterium]